MLLSQAEAAIALSYPEPENKGKFLGFWLSFRVGKSPFLLLTRIYLTNRRVTDWNGNFPGGQILGGVISENYNNP
jgi:hypothetical protein